MAGLQRKTPLRAKGGLKSRKPMARGKPLNPGKPMERKPMKKASRPKRSKIRDSAKMQQCQVRVAGICNHNPETVVLAHRNGAGMGCKADDHNAAYACSACHDWLDGGYVQYGHTRLDRDTVHDKAILRTQHILARKGLYNPEEAVT